MKKKIRMKNNALHTMIYSRYLTCFFLLYLPFQLVAQRKKDTTVVVRDEFKVKIADPQKYLEVPVINDTLKEKINFRYELNSRRVNTVYEIDPLKAASIKNESLYKLFKGYARAGYGSYTTPYAEIFYNHTRSKIYGAGIHYKHLSSSGQIKDRGNSAFSNNELNLGGKYFIKKSTLAGGIDYRHNMMHYYGFNPSTPENSNLLRDSIRQYYQLIKLNASLGENFPIDSQATKYHADINYYNYSDRSKNMENGFHIGGNTSFYYKTYALSAKGYLDYFNNKNSMDTSSMTIFNLLPYITFNQDLWRLKAGINTYFSSDETNKFNVVPELDLDFHIYKNIIILNAGTDSRLKRNSWKNLTQENPFLRGDIPASNSWAPLRFYAGLRGSVGSKIAFYAKASYVNIENQYFFVNDTSAGNEHKMNIVFDNVSLTEIHGELTWKKTNRYEVFARVNFRGYKTDKEEKAWHIPAFQMAIGGKYNLEDKIIISPTILYLSRQFSREITTTDSLNNKKTTVNAKSLKGITDVNLNVEYRYNKRLGMFLQLNNILNIRYERFREYPTQRFNLLAGIGYSF